MSKPTIKVVRKLRPARYVILRGRGKAAKPVTFPGRFAGSFRYKADADIVAYWLRRG